MKNIFARCVAAPASAEFPTLPPDFQHLVKSLMIRGIHIALGISIQDVHPVVNADILALSEQLNTQLDENQAA